MIEDLQASVVIQSNLSGLPAFGVPFSTLRQCCAKACTWKMRYGLGTMARAGERKALAGGAYDMLIPRLERLQVKVRGMIDLTPCHCL